MAGPARASGTVCTSKPSIATGNGGRRGFASVTTSNALGDDAAVDGSAVAAAATDGVRGAGSSW